jgi:hypothetical protein
MLSFDFGSSAMPTLTGEKLTTEECSRSCTAGVKSAVWLEPWRATMTMGYIAAKKRQMFVTATNKEKGPP